MTMSIGNKSELSESFVTIQNHENDLSESLSYKTISVSPESLNDYLQKWAGDKDLKWDRYRFDEEECTWGERYGKGVEPIVTDTTDHHRADMECIRFAAKCMHCGMRWRRVTPKPEDFAEKGKVYSALVKEYEPLLEGHNQMCLINEFREWARINKSKWPQNRYDLLQGWVVNDYKLTAKCNDCNYERCVQFEPEHFKHTLSIPVHEIKDFRATEFCDALIQHAQECEKCESNKNVKHTKAARRSRSLRRLQRDEDRGAAASLSPPAPQPTAQTAPQAAEQVEMKEEEPVLFQKYDDQSDSEDISDSEDDLILKESDGKTSPTNSEQGPENTSENGSDSINSLDKLVEWSNGTKDTINSGGDDLEGAMVQAEEEESFSLRRLERRNTASFLSVLHEPESASHNTITSDLSTSDST